MPGPECHAEYAEAARRPQGIAIILLFAFVNTALAQTPVFEVASIKPNLSDSESRRTGTDPGGRFTATNVSLKQLICYAFDARDFQVTGGPGWMDTEKFDLAARAAASKELSRDEVKPYVQALLTDRFRLKIHRALKEGTVYSLLVSKNGAKLKAHPGEGRAGISSSTGDGKANITGTKVTIARLAEYLGGLAGRPVLDHTGLPGEYDFRLEWSENQDAMATSLFSALQEQLGLKLESVKGSIDMIVVDSAERPSAN